MSVIKTRTRTWVALGTVLATMLAASVALGETPTACEVAYLTTGATAQQPTLESACAVPAR